MNLYLRLLRVLLKLPFIAPRALLESGRLAFRVWPNDCDINFHLNNGRYLTFMDLGRVHLLAQIGLLRLLVRRKWAPVLSAAEMNFIRPLNPFQKFELVTRLLTWDEKYFYIEQRFISPGRLHAVGMVKGLFLHGRDRVETEKVLRALNLEIPPPDVPEVVRHWNDLAVLKKKDLGSDA